MSRRISRHARFRMYEIATAVGLALAVTSGANAADDINPPADPVAKAAFEVLEKHCARCHQEGRLTSRERPAKNFGNVLKMDEIADTPSLILPGNPYGSKLFKQIVDQEMPYDVIYEGAAAPEMSEADIKSLETWIKGLGDSSRKIAVQPAPAAAPKAVAAAPAPAPENNPPANAPAADATDKPAATAEAAPALAESENAAAPPPANAPAVAENAAAPAPAAVGCDAHKFVPHKDVVALIAADIDKLPSTRVRGTRYLTLTHLTNTCTKDKHLEVYRQGAIKLINSLSRSSDVVTLETIDPDRSILRINIDDLGWDAADWDAVAASYPYAMRPDTQLNSVLEAATGTKLPYLRADWFAFVASRPGVYERLLKLPKTFQALTREQGVDIEGNIRRYIAKRAGFQKSGVSQNNRLIERHPSRSGYFWTSYDFAGNKGRQSLFEHPMGPGGSRGFEHDGGETIFSLPNGFQAYYLNTAKGAALDKGPTTIVRDMSRKDLAVTNGISCMGCHDQGMRKAKDDIRDVVTKGRSRSKAEREAIIALHPTHAEMDKIIADDATRFKTAMERAGLNPILKLNGVEMINALSDRYEADVDINLAAAEFGMTKDEFANAAGDADREFKTLIRRLEQSTVPRDQFESVYVKLARNITDDEPVRVAASGKTVIKPAKTAAIAAELALTSDQDVYNRGDRPVFTVVSKQDCFLTLTNVDDKGEGTVLFPNRFQQANRIRANVPVQLPGSDAPFQYRVKDKGVETVIAVCTPAKANVDGIKHDFGREAFTSVDDYTRSVSRAISIEARPATSAKRPIPQVVTSSKRRNMLRSAIKIEVQ